MKTVNKEIDCICNFDKEGKQRPVRIRLKDENESYQVIDIDKLLHMEEEKIGGTKDKVRKFRCECVINGVKRIIELKYDLPSMCWLLYRI
jgi:hypothetical protein